MTAFVCMYGAETRESVRTGGVVGEGRTGNRLGTDLECYRYTSLLGVRTLKVLTPRDELKDTPPLVVQASSVWHVLSGHSGVLPHITDEFLQTFTVISFKLL
jgi:hypothetical protein